ncbi:TldD/PmbA family protein [Actimicrobium antarcticum]|uniref:TldD/PmbA family protein n=1 Tax=Actimicrobium antarcticum TaxID=1051899 RepID=A0ABP7SL88_9BURK
MQTYFYQLADLIGTQLQGSEQYQCWYSAEASDFVRFNRSAIRQCGHVRQSSLSLHLIDGRRHCSASATLAGHLAADRATLAQLMATLRTQLPDLPDDPHLLVATEVRSTEHNAPSRLPAAAEIVDQVLHAAAGVDLVGILAMGPVMRGFANAAGQRNWHQSATFNLDWSLYQSRDKAVKTSYAGADWDSTVFSAKMHGAMAQLVMLQRAPVTVKPGAYRAFLTPTAMQELVSMFNWDGLSEKSLRTRQSALRRMRDENVRLHPAITLSEDTYGGMGPGFQSDGFLKPDRIALIEQGVLTGSMISPRTAMEYGLANNGAGSGEAMSAIDLAGGTLPMAQALAELDTGIYVSNLWYLNFSDRANCRITGMTRFATFWVEGGEIKAPLNVMRFDESLFRLLGDKLLALTSERELLLDSDSYGERATGSARLPGALVKDFTFVL